MIFGVSAIPETCCYSLSRGVAACGQKLNYNNMLRFSSRKKVFSLARLPLPHLHLPLEGFFFSICLRYLLANNAADEAAHKKVREGPHKLLVYSVISMS